MVNLSILAGLTAATRENVTFQLFMDMLPNTNANALLPFTSKLDTDALRVSEKYYKKGNCVKGMKIA